MDVERPPVRFELIAREPGIVGAGQPFTLEFDLEVKIDSWPFEDEVVELRLRVGVEGLKLVYEAPGVRFYSDGRTTPMRVRAVAPLVTGSYLELLVGCVVFDPALHTVLDERRWSMVVVKKQMLPVVVTEDPDLVPTAPAFILGVPTTTLVVGQTYVVTARPWLPPDERSDLDAPASQGAYRLEVACSSTLGAVRDEGQDLTWAPGDMSSRNIILAPRQVGTYMLFVYLIHPDDRMLAAAEVRLTVV